jgi:crotonobetainyl-CoA:carnitine CoA-transferase CaiB-like acyl-CoA transferase
LAHWNGEFDGTAIEGCDEAISGSPGYGVYATADDRWVSLGVIAEDRFWSDLCHALGLEEHAELTYVERLRRHENVNAAVAVAIAQLTRDDAVACLEASGVPVAPVLTRKESLAALGREALLHPARYRHHPVGTSEDRSAAPMGVNKPGTVRR